MVVRLFKLEKPHLSSRPFFLPASTFTLTNSCGLQTTRQPVFQTHPPLCQGHILVPSLTEHLDPSRENRSVQAPDLPLKCLLPIRWQSQKFCEPGFLVAACISDLSHPVTKHLAGSLRKAGFTLVQGRQELKVTDWSCTSTTGEQS